MKITTDWHIHSRHSCECHECGSTVAGIIASAAAHRITAFGLTDHLHSRYNLPDLAAARLEYLAADPPAHFHFGVEVTCMRRWELDEINAGKYDYQEPPVYGIGQDGPKSKPAIALAEPDAEILGIEYVIGGVHWARGIPPEPKAIIDFFHSQMMYLAAHPLVKIVAHPWWWHDHFMVPEGGYVPGPWREDFSVIPASYHDEFIAALVEHDTAAELNPRWMLARPFGDRGCEQYLAYFAAMRQAGVKFAVGSDCHGTPYAPKYDAATEGLLDDLGLSEDDLWSLPPRGGPMPGAPVAEVLAALGLTEDDLWCNPLDPETL